MSIKMMGDFEHPVGKLIKTGSCPFEIQKKDDNKTRHISSRNHFQFRFQSIYQTSRQRKFH